VTKKMTLNEAAKRVSEIGNQIDALVTEAETICDETGYDGFGLNVAYGMGGHYRPDPRKVEQWEGKPEDYEIEKGEDGEYRYEYSQDDGDEGGYWAASSRSC
jgi:hypothetical protein